MSIRAGMAVGETPREPIRFTVPRDGGRAHGSRWASPGGRHVADLSERSEKALVVCPPAPVAQSDIASDDAISTTHRGANQEIRVSDECKAQDEMP